MNIQPKKNIVSLILIVLLLTFSVNFFINNIYFKAIQAQRNMNSFRESMILVKYHSRKMNQSSLPIEREELLTNIDFTVQEFDKALISLNNLRPYVNRLHPLGLINRAPDDFYNIHVPKCLFEHYKEHLIDIKSSLNDEEFNLESLQSNLSTFKREMEYITVVLLVKDTWDKDSAKSFLTINELLLDIGLTSGYFTGDALNKFEKCRP